MLLRLALQMARDDYESRRERQRQGIALAKEKGLFKGRKANKKLQEQVIAFRSTGLSANKTAALVGCSRTHVSRIWQAAQLKTQKNIQKHEENGQQDIEMFL